MLRDLGKEEKITVAGNHECKKKLVNSAQSSQESHLLWVFFN